MKYFRFFIVFICFAEQGFAQPATEALTRLVADRIIANTSFQFVNTKTGQLYAPADDMPASTEIRAESPYNKWEYWNGVLLSGMMELAAVTKQEKYSNYAVRNFDFVFDNAGRFKKLYDAGQKPEWLYFFRMDKLDDCGALAAALVDVNKLHPVKAYTQYLEKTAGYILGKQSRFKDSTLCREVPRRMTLWADDLYMSVPFLARMGKATGDARYFEDAILQVKHFNDYLYDASSGLYYHCFYNDVHMNGVARWGRCNGWLAMAQVELLGHLPADHPQKALLQQLLLRQIVGFSRYQDTSGLWHQLLDKQDAYLETSATAMFVYAVARAVNEGWINASYLKIAADGWKALCHKVTADGQLMDVCIGTGIADNVQFYYNRPKRLNDIHGLGALLLAGCEMIKAEKKKI